MAKGRSTIKQRIALATKICDLYAAGDVTIDSCCLAVGVPYDTFKNWVAPNIDDIESLDNERLKIIKRRGYVPEVRELYKKATEVGDINFRKLLANEARRSLLKRVRGFEYEEVSSEVRHNPDGTVTPISVRKTTKVVAPSDVATIFALKNVDKENFSEKQTIQHEGLEKVRRDYEKMSATELAEEEARLDAALALTTAPELTGDRQRYIESSDDDNENQ